MNRWRSKWGKRTAAIGIAAAVGIAGFSAFCLLKDLDNFGFSASESVQGQNIDSSAKDASTLGLEVEEVYLTAGATAKAGDAVLKLSPESVTEYREMLKESCRLAERRSRNMTRRLWNCRRL